MHTIKILYTYYEPISYIKKTTQYSQMELISICQASWHRFGWQLKILGEKEASSHPYYEEYKSIISDLPSVNPGQYDYHCFMRWLAMAQIGGGVMIDYDVMNLGITDIDFFDNIGLTIYQGHVPCVVSGSSDDYTHTAMKFGMLKNDMSCRQLIGDTYHASDMVMLASKKINFNSLNIVTDYPNHGKLVHCSHAACGKIGKSKIEIMKNFLKYDFHEENKEILSNLREDK